MRSRLNSALVVVAGSLALVLTVVRQSPEGVVSVGLDTQEVRAAPGEARNLRHDLSALKIFNLVLVRIKERYVDPARIDPRKMLYAALDSVQYNIPEVLVEPDASRNKVTVAVNDKKEIFDTEDVDSPWRLSAKLKRIFRFIETNMNAGGDLAKVEYAAVNGMLSTLDPHSVLMDPEAARDMDVQTSGKFGGLGIVIRMIEKKLTVIRPMKGTPAWKKGIKAGDHIVKINSELTEHLTSNEAVERMRGNPNTPVTLWITRKGVDQLMKFELTRDVIRMSQVESKLLDKGVGYIKVKQFSKGISSDVADSAEDAIGQGRDELDPRPPLQPGRSARRSRPAVRSVRRCGHGRDDRVGSRSRGAPRRAWIRRHELVARRPRERRLGVGLRDRRRCTQEPRPRGDRRYAHVR
jgi:carboxyl-terminal processing protease